VPGTTGSETSGTHNGVAWTKASSSSAAQVVIKGQANIYRTKFTSNGGQSSEYQTYFAPEGDANTKAKQVTIKITIKKS